MSKREKKLPKFPVWDVRFITQGAIYAALVAAFTLIPNPIPRPFGGGDLGGVPIWLGGMVLGPMWGAILNHAADFAHMIQQGTLPYDPYSGVFAIPNIGGWWYSQINYHIFLVLYFHLTIKKKWSPWKAVLVLSAPSQFAVHTAMLGTYVMIIGWEFGLGYWLISIPGYMVFHYFHWVIALVLYQFLERLRLRRGERKEPQLPVGWQHYDMEGSNVKMWFALDIILLFAWILILPFAAPPNPPGSLEKYAYVYTQIAWSIVNWKTLWEYWKKNFKCGPKA